MILWKLKPHIIAPLTGMLPAIMVAIGKSNLTAFRGHAPGTMVFTGPKTAFVDEKLFCHFEARSANESAEFNEIFQGYEE